MHELRLIVGLHLDDHVQCTLESMLEEFFLHLNFQLTCMGAV